MAYFAQGSGIQAYKIRHKVAWGHVERSPGSLNFSRQWWVVVMI